MSSGTLLVEAAETRLRADSGIFWESCGPRSILGRGPVSPPRSYASTHQFRLSTPENPRIRREGHDGARTDGAAYVHDGSLEGILTAVYRAILARDATADLVDSQAVQPRLGQTVIPVQTDLESALMARRLLEYSQGIPAYECVRAASASDDPRKGGVIYRFMQRAMAATERRECFRCPRKGSCLKACSAPASCRLLDDLGDTAVYDLMTLYRAVMNERHKMEQFVRFQHCEGDLWFARCNPNASVVPLLMDWFVARFNDQRFVIYDENHAMTGIYDGERWCLVAGEEPVPPEAAGDERRMQSAWRRFYQSVSVEARFHPELRRNFMPLRLWKNLPELREDPPSAFAEA